MVGYSCTELTSLKLVSLPRSAIFLKTTGLSLRKLEIWDSDLHAGQVHGESFVLYSSSSLDIVNRFCYIVPTVSVQLATTTAIWSKFVDVLADFGTQLVSVSGDDLH